MGSIFNEHGVPHLNTTNSCASTIYSKHVEGIQSGKPSNDAHNPGEHSRKQKSEERRKAIREGLDEAGRAIDKLLEHFQESGKRMDKILEGLDELALYAGIDAESDYDSDSGDQPAEIGRLDPLSSSDCASTELVSLADCCNLTSYKSSQEDVDHNSNPAAEQTAGTWSGPGSKATSPLEAFFKHYFLSDRTVRKNWIPSRKKTRQPIILYGATDIDEVYETAKRVKGLHKCSAGTPPNRVVVLGWNRFAVWLRASEVSASSYSEDVRRYMFDTARQFAKAMNGERIGLRLNKAENWTENAFEGILDHLQGSYLVRWRDVGGGWDVRAVLSLEIGMGPRKNILEATLRFPGAEEKMLLAHKFKTLDAYLDGSLKEKEETGDNDGEEAGGDERDKAGGDKGNTTGDDRSKKSGYENGRKTYPNVKQPAKPDSNEHDKPVDAPERGTIENPISSATDDPSQKPSRGTIGNPHKFIFIAQLCYRVVGRSTDGCRGHIHWTGDRTFTSFTGSGFLPYLKGEVRMEGWEI